MLKLQEDVIGVQVVEAVELFVLIVRPHGITVMMYIRIVVILTLL